MYKGLATFHINVAVTANEMREGLSVSGLPSLSYVRILFYSCSYYFCLLSPIGHPCDRLYE